MAPRVLLVAALAAVAAAAKPACPATGPPAAVAVPGYSLSRAKCIVSRHPAMCASALASAPSPHSSLPRALLRLRSRLLRAVATLWLRARLLRALRARPLA